LEDHNLGAKRSPTAGRPRPPHPQEGEADMAGQDHKMPSDERTDPTALRSALWLPIFDSLADPAVVARLAAEAEEAGWHGVFVWDHLRWRAPVRQVADPWITLAAIATSSKQVRLGPMVTPLARRRPAKVARETATLDRLSGGRLTLGVGLGSDRFGSELSRPASSSTTGCEARCWTRRSRS
jgi:Luciferase-like monooxygenase